MSCAHHEPALVLVADDDLAMRELARAVLADRFQVIEATDGQEAWQLIKAHHPPVVVLDWEMPFHTGIELAAVIKGDPILKGTHLILLTGRGAPADLRAGKDAGVDAYLIKPVSPDALLAAVERLSILA